jgi:hypothetical protein
LRKDGDQRPALRLLTIRDDEKTRLKRRHQRPEESAASVVGFLDEAQTCFLF